MADNAIHGLGPGFFGGQGAEAIVAAGEHGGPAIALDELVGLFGSNIRSRLCPVARSGWLNDPRIGGSYSHALPGQSDARQILSAPYEGSHLFPGRGLLPRGFLNGPRSLHDRHPCCDRGPGGPSKVASAADLARSRRVWGHPRSPTTLGSVAPQSIAPSPRNCLCATLACASRTFPMAAVPMARCTAAERSWTSAGV